jgi:hypothetical protein
MAEQMFFKVKAGRHHHTKGPNAGEFSGANSYITDDKPLDELFVNKYERVREEEVPKDQLKKLKGQLKKGDPATNNENADKFNARMQKENTIDTRSVSTPERGADNTDLSKDEVDLPTNTPEDASKPRRTGEEESEKPKAKKKAEKKPAKDEEEDEGSELGEDVTEEFDGAGEKGLKVYKDGKKYFVAAEDDPDEPLSPKKGIDRKSKVDKFIENYEAEEDDDE